MNKWDNRFMQMAALIASFSKDPSTQVGAVITQGRKIISLGFNGAPSGVLEPTERDVKILRTLHAEVNAVLFAARDLRDCTIYVTHPPCAQCAALIIQTGIRRVVFAPPSDDFLSRWRENHVEAMRMFNEAGVTVDLAECEGVTP